jgi:mono/diheme cytochrome c family protein
MVIMRAFALAALLATAGSSSVCLAGNLTYSHDAKPIFDGHCIECHHPGGKDPDLTQFPFPSTISTDQTVIVNKILTAAGGSQPQMPPGVRPKLTADELSVLSTWLQQGLDP